MANGRILILTVYIAGQVRPLSGLFSRRYMYICFWFFPESRIWYFMQIVSNRYNLYEMLNPVLGGNKQNISICRLLKILARVLCIDRLIYLNDKLLKHSYRYLKLCKKIFQILSLPEQNRTKALFKTNVLHRPYADGIWDVHVQIPTIKKWTSVCYRVEYESDFFFFFL